MPPPPENSLVKNLLSLDKTVLLPSMDTVMGSAKIFAIFIRQDGGKEGEG